MRDANEVLAYASGLRYTLPRSGDVLGAEDLRSLHRNEGHDYSKALSYLQRVVPRLAGGQCAGGQVLPQRSPFEQLAHQVRRVLVLASIEHRHDVRMIERRQHLRLLLEAPQPVCVSR